MQRVEGDVDTVGVEAAAALPEWSRRRHGAFGRTLLSGGNTRPYEATKAAEKPPPRADSAVAARGRPELAGRAPRLLQLIF